MQINKPTAARHLLWANSEEEMSRGVRWSLHPLDADYRVLRTPHHTVYMAYNPINISDESNINVAAGRILLEQQRLDPPVINRHHPDGLAQYYRCLPAEHVVLFAMKTHKPDVMCDYTRSMVSDDWALLMKQNIPAELKPYNRIIRDRYSDASQPLTEYEQTHRITPLVQSIIGYYLRIRHGAADSWDKAQLLLLTAAMRLQFTRDWCYGDSEPRFRKTLF
jgi:hypothetical protein